MEEVRQALQQARLQACEFTGHSFHIGAATSAAEQGLPDWLIQTLGRWQSSAYTTYIRTPKETLCAVAKKLVTEDRKETEKQEGDIEQVYGGGWGSVYTVGVASHLSHPSIQCPNTSGQPVIMVGR